MASIRGLAIASFLAAGLMGCAGTPQVPAPEPVAELPAPRPVPLGPGMNEGFLQTWIQVAAYRRLPNAATGWDVLSRRYPDALDGLVPAVTIATSRADRGSFYQLLVGPLRTSHAARARCLALAEAGHSGCFIRRVTKRPAWPPESLRDEVPLPRRGPG